MRKNGIALAAALVVLGAAGSVWALGLGVGYVLPTSDFGDAYSGGFGAHVTYETPLAPTVTGYGDVGWTSFMGESLPNGTDLPDIDVWNFTAGAKAGLGGLYVGGELGYYTEVDEFGLSPLVGMGFGPLDISARYKLTGDANWFDVRAGITLGR